MNNTVDNYLFLGLPKSGKTTYFSLMVRCLQDFANDTNYLKFKYLPTITREEDGNKQYEDTTTKFIDDCIDKVRNQRWPVKTQDYDAGYSFELDKFYTICDSPILQDYIYRKAEISYHDYPGEAFEVAFNAAKNPDFDKAAESIKERIINAKGIFFILDAEAMFNGSDRKVLNTTGTELFRFITESNSKVKLAIIFNKLESFPREAQYKPDFIAMLKKNCGNLYAHLPRNHKFFDDVYPLGSVDIKEDGMSYPPKVLSPKNILEPIKWMTGF